MSGRTRSNLLGLAGAVAGGLLGFFLFRGLWNVGLYGLMLPGALLGLGCNLLAQHRSWPRGLACAAAAVALGLVSEWSVAPFEIDRSLGYFLKHLHRLDRGWYALGLVALGAALALWWGALPRLERPLPAPPARRPIEARDATERP